MIILGSITMRISAVLAVLSTFLFLLGYCSRGWVEGNSLRENRDNISDLHIGLWKTCYFDEIEQRRFCKDTQDFLLADWNEEWLPAVCGFFTIAFLMNCLSTVLTCTYVMLPFVRKYETLPIFVNICVLFVTVAMSSLGLLIFGIQHSSDHTNFYGTDIDWCFWMIMFTLLFNAITCCLLMYKFNEMLDGMIHLKQKKQRQKKVLQALEDATMETRNSTQNDLQSHTTASSSVHSENTGYESNENTDRIPMADYSRPSTSKGTSVATYPPVQESSDSYVTPVPSIVDSSDTSDSEAYLTGKFQHKKHNIEQDHIPKGGGDDLDKQDRNASELPAYGKPAALENQKGPEHKSTPVHLFHAKPNYFKLPPLGLIPDSPKDTNDNKMPVYANSKSKQLTELKTPRSLNNSNLHNLNKRSKLGHRDDENEEKNELSKSVPTDLFITQKSNTKSDKISQEDNIDNENLPSQSVPTDLFITEKYGKKAQSEDYESNGKALTLPHYDKAMHMESKSGRNSLSKSIPTNVFYNPKFSYEKQNAQINKEEKSQDTTASDGDSNIDQANQNEKQLKKQFRKKKIAHSDNSVTQSTPVELFISERNETSVYMLSPEEC